MAAAADDKVRSSVELADRSPVLPVVENPEPAKASLHPAVYVAYVQPRSPGQSHLAMGTER